MSVKVPPISTPTRKRAIYGSTSAGSQDTAGGARHPRAWRMRARTPGVAAERGAAAILAGSHHVLDVFVAVDADRLLRFRHLDRLRRHVGVDVGIAVEPVRIGASAPRRGGEVDINERLAVRVVAADRDA